MTTVVGELMLIVCKSQTEPTVQRKPYNRFIEVYYIVRKMQAFVFKNANHVVLKCLIHILL